MSLYIPKMSDTPGVTIPGLADNFNLLADSRIVEHGSNENGHYWRWESGLQVCMLGVSLPGEGSENMAYTWNLPAAFMNLPSREVARNVFAIISGGNRIYNGPGNNATSVHATRISSQSARNPTSNTNIIFEWSTTVVIQEERYSDFRFLAIGRWK